tara:strand:- start:768 stop:1367 length:600 start_codon:yes stop_codon:yes gene_type:complete
MLQQFLKTTFTNVRGKKRTDALHDAILSKLKKEYPKYKNYDWEFEVSLDGDSYGGKFKIDILGVNKTTGKIVVILCKCNNSNIGKNIYNMANTTLGESHRLLDGPLENKIEKILFISIFPNVAPNFKNNGTIRGWDNIATNYKNRINTNKSLDKHFNGKVEEVNIFYDIKDMDLKNTRKDFKNIIPLNITKIELKHETM